MDTGACCLLPGEYWQWACVSQDLDPNSPYLLLWACLMAMEGTSFSSQRQLLRACVWIVPFRGHVPGSNVIQNPVSFVLNLYVTSTPTPFSLSPTKVASEAGRCVAQCLTMVLVSGDGPGREPPCQAWSWKPWWFLLLAAGDGQGGEPHLPALRPAHMGGVDARPGLILTFFRIKSVFFFEFSLSKVERQVKCLRTPSRFKRGGLANFNMILFPRSFTEIIYTIIQIL